MKRFFCLILSFAFILPALFVFGGSRVKAKGKVVNELSVDAKSAYLMDFDSGEVLFASNENERLPIASMTKIMTLLLAFEAIDAGTVNLNDEVLVSENASGMGGSQVFLDANTNYKLSDLIKSIVVSSANDASVAVAEKLSGSEENFVKKMNEKALSLGLQNTQFANCTGLPNDDGYSSAKDVAIMFKQLLNHEKYFDFSKIYLDTLVHPSGRQTQLSNTNKLVKFYSGCDAGKTGSTSQAKFCLCATSKRGDARFIASVIGCENAKIRNAQVSNLFNYAFNNFKSSKLVTTSDYIQVQIKKANKESFVAGPESDFSVLVKSNDKNNTEIKTIIFENISAPVLKGQKVGEIEIYKDGEKIKTINVVAKEQVNKPSYLEVLKNLFKTWSL